MTLLAALLAASQAASQPAPQPPPAPPSYPAAPLAAARGGCSARLPLAGGVLLELGYHGGRDESYFRLWDPSWPPLRDGASHGAVLHFAPGDEEGAQSLAARTGQAGERIALYLHAGRGPERLLRIGRAGSFVLYVGDRLLGTYVLPRAEAAVTLLLACARVAAAAPPAQDEGPALESYFSTDDYPAEALRLVEQGTVRFAILVDAEGRVADCTVTVSSGSASLDEATCRIVRERMRYRPAGDPQGNAVARREADLAVTWSLPDD
jgi:TonB family protein